MWTIQSSSFKCFTAFRGVSVSLLFLSSLSVTNTYPFQSPVCNRLFCCGEGITDTGVDRVCSGVDTTCSGTLSGVAVGVLSCLNCLQAIHHQMKVVLNWNNVILMKSERLIVFQIIITFLYTTSSIK